MGLSSNALFVLSIDGDGQFVPSEVADFFKLSSSSNFQVAEGCRINRDEPGYRKVLSFLTRLLVFSRSRRLPKDGNTPLRLYNPKFLLTVLELIPEISLIPNLRLSCISRNLGVRIQSRDVNFLQRRGAPSGTMFGPSKQRLMPSKRLLKFVFSAFKEWTRADDGKRGVHKKQASHPFYF